MEQYGKLKENHSSHRGIVGSHRCIIGLLMLCVSVCFIVMNVAIAFHTVVYGNHHFLESEYAKYDVFSQLPMSEDDVLRASDHMMDYLIGKKDTLQVFVTADGRETDFFNEQDRFHMAEVGRIFRGIYKAGTYAALIGAGVLGIFFLLYMHREKNCTGFIRQMSRELIKYYAFLFVLSFIIVGMIVIAACVDFNFVFIRFHQIFFDNDLWMFDPSSDYMIRMLPEGLFFDAFLRIGAIFSALTVLEFMILYALRGRKK